MHFVHHNLHCCKLLYQTVLQLSIVLQICGGNGACFFEGSLEVRLVYDPGNIDVFVFLFQAWNGLRFNSLIIRIVQSGGSKVESCTFKFDIPCGINILPCTENIAWHYLSLAGRNLIL